MGAYSKFNSGNAIHRRLLARVAVQSQQFPDWVPYEGAQGYPEAAGASNRWAPMAQTLYNCRPPAGITL